jgi:hypothetical protein
LEITTRVEGDVESEIFRDLVEFIDGVVRSKEDCI